MKDFRGEIGGEIGGAKLECTYKARHHLWILLLAFAIDLKVNNKVYHFQPKWLVPALTTSSYAVARYEMRLS